MAFPDERLIERVNIPSVLFERRATLAELEVDVEPFVSAPPPVEQRPEADSGIKKLEKFPSRPVPIDPLGDFCPPPPREARPDDVGREALFLARPASGMRTCSPYADNDFAKMRS